MARTIRFRKPSYQIAVLGEGETEWHYFTDLARSENFPFKVAPSLPKHSDYESIFREAQKLVSEGYDLVFCVLDLDTVHANPAQKEKYLVQKSKILEERRIRVIESMPCIEYWFLIHFINFSTKYYRSCNELANALASHLPEYQKSRKFLGKAKLFQKLKSIGDLEKAKATAKRTRETMEANPGILTSYSNVDLLLDRLDKEKEKRNRN